MKGIHTFLQPVFRNSNAIAQNKRHDGYDGRINKVICKSGERDNRGNEAGRSAKPGPCHGAQFENERL